MSKTGYEALSRLLAEADGLEKIELPRDVTTFALAKCCWEFWSKQEGDMYYCPDCTLYHAIGEMITWIKSVFIGGETWMRCVDFEIGPPDARHVHEILDKSGKFSMASRKFWDFCLRGEAKQGRRRSSSAGYNQPTIPELE